MQAPTRCADLGLAAPPAKPSLLRDTRTANAAFVVDTACQATPFVAENATGRSGVALNASSARILVVVSYPAVALLDLAKNHIEPFDFSGDRQLMELSLAENQLSSLEGFRFPQQLQALDLSGNNLQTVANLSLSESVRSLNLSGCSLSWLRGLRLPWDLEQLDLSNNPLSEIEIREADVEVLRRLRSAFPVIPNQQCSHANATLTRVNNTASACVIPDKAFDAMYPPLSSTTPAPTTTTTAVVKSSSNQQTIIIIVLAVAGVVLVALLFIGYQAFSGKYDLTSSIRRVRDRRRNATQEEAKSSGEFIVSSETGERPLGFPMEYFEADDVRFDVELAQYRVPKDEIKKKKLLARGGFGVVYLAKYRGMTVAVKQLQRDRMRYRTIEQFMKEIRLLASLNHPHIVGFLGLAWSTLHDLAIVLEYLPRGDLYSLLRQQRKREAKSPTTRAKFDWFHSTSSDMPTKASIAMDVADALAYLHSQQTPIIHRDLKSKNVLLSSDLRAKLTDFGISRMQTVEETMTREIGTVAWIAPEVLKGGRYSEKADIYSFGVLLTELDTCHAPYTIGIGVDATKRTNTWIASMVSAGSLQPSLLESCPMQIRELTLKCLSYDAGIRPSAVELSTWLQAMRVAFR